MTRIVLNPEELRRFASFLEAQCGELRGRKSAIEAAFCQLAEYWKDKKQHRHEADFEYTSKLLDAFLAHSDAYMSYLRKKARKADAYLNG
jgi:hypothetical protein